MGGVTVDQGAVLEVYLKHGPDRVLVQSEGNERTRGPGTQVRESFASLPPDASQKQTKPIVVQLFHSLLSAS